MKIFFFSFVALLFALSSPARAQQFCNCFGLEDYLASGVIIGNGYAQEYIDDEDEGYDTALYVRRPYARPLVRPYAYRRPYVARPYVYRRPYEGRY